MFKKKGIKYLKNKFYMIVMIFASFFVLFLQEGKAADKLPTIEYLTKGKVKIGDLIDKNNVDLVKEYLTAGICESVRRGMVLRMSPEQLTPEQMVMKNFLEITERNKGKAVMDKNGTVYFQKEGTLWPGGIPFPKPKTGLEIMANEKFGLVWDDLQNSPIRMDFIDRSGKLYKTSIQMHKYLHMTGRMVIPPLGAFAGSEDMFYKRLMVTKSPRNIKGMGQFTVRYYDDSANPDTGFMYLPAFKRIMRFSTTNWQDNIIGSDITSGDGRGLQEPLSTWSFKLIKTNYMLFPECKSPFQLLYEDGTFDKQLKFDLDRKYVRLGWRIYPIHIIEGKCKFKHIYGKKILYVHEYPHWPSGAQITAVDSYDRKMELWKSFFLPKGYYYELNGEPYASDHGGIMEDLQADHVTQVFFISNLNKMELKPQDITIKSLIQAGR
jgi:hypothetical protein